MKKTFDAFHKHFTELAMRNVELTQLQAFNDLYFSSAERKKEESYKAELKKIQENLRKEIANGFKLLVEKYFIEIRSVNDYAKKLNVSTKHLSEVVSKTFGRSPLQIIHDILLLEAKGQLYSTEKSVSEIAYDLKFDDPSHFAQFIKSRTGLSPQKLRKKLIILHFLPKNLHLCLTNDVLSLQNKYTTKK